MDSVIELLIALNNPFVSSIVFDEDGSIFDALFGPDSGVLGFAGPNFLDFPPAIFSGVAALNGAWLDGDPSNGELTVEGFQAVFFHEFGHFSGLDHSQVNGIKFVIPSDHPGNPVQQIDPVYVETMFPFLVTDDQRTPHRDDIAHLSSLYPTGGATSVFGPNDGLDLSATMAAMRGNIYFADEMTPVQGVNVIARSNRDKLGDAVAFVSGSLYTGNRASVDFDFFPGEGPPELIGFYVLNNLMPGGRYKVEIEEINSAFTGGSSVGPQSPPLNLIPGGGGFILTDSFNNQESGSGLTDNPRAQNAVKIKGAKIVSGIDISLNDIGPDPNEPNDDFNDATPLELGSLTAGTMVHPAQDVDYYRFTLGQASVVTLETFPWFPTTGLADTTLGLFDDSGTLIMSDDDGGEETLSMLEVALAAGDCFVAVSTSPDDSFDQTVNASDKSIGTYLLGVDASPP